MGGHPGGQGKYYEALDLTTPLLRPYGDCPGLGTCLGTHPSSSTDPAPLDSAASSPTVTDVARLPAIVYPIPHLLPDPVKSGSCTLNHSTAFLNPLYIICFHNLVDNILMN